MVSQQPFDKLQVFFSSGNQFGYRKVVHFKAKTCSPTGILIVNRNEALLPSSRQYRGFFADAVGIVAEGLMKWGSLTYAPVDQFGVARCAERKQIGLDGNEQFRWRVGKLTQDGLTANDYELCRARNTRGCAKNMLKLLALHGGGEL